MYLARARRGEAVGALPPSPRARRAARPGGRAPPSWRGATPPTADFFAAKGELEAVLDALRVDWRRGRAPTSRSCIPAARATVSRGTARSAGSARSIRSSRATWDLERRRRRSSSTSARSSPPRRPSRATTTSRRFPAAPGHRGRRRRRRAGRRACSSVIRAAGGKLLRSARGLRRLPRRADRRGPRVARGAAGVPRARPHAHRRRRRPAPREDRRRAARPSWGLSCVAECRRLASRRRRASGYAGALAAHARRPPPALRARAVTAAATPARGSTSSTRTTACRSCSSELDLDAHGDVDAAIVAYPHRAAAPVVAALRERGVRVVDLSRRLPPARPRDLRATGTASTARRSCSATASTGCPSCYREQIAGADLVANPGCYPTATLLALAPLARAGLIADVVIDAKSGVSGAGRAPTPSARTSSPSTRT